MDRREPGFRDAQEAHFEAADVEQFRWTTQAPGIVESEDELLEPLLGRLTSPCLEVGCGEGNNLLRLTRHLDCVGVDLFPKKLIFAAQELPGTRFSAADAARLPFADASFPSVFLRDLLHHVPEPEAVMREVVRVLQPGGQLVLLEPNGRNPLIRLQTHLVPAEIGARESGFQHIEGLLRSQALRDIEIEAQQPLALRRALLHYKMGIPALAGPRWMRQSLSALESAIGRLMPRSFWTYVVATATRA